jgi:hypothetical protein
MLHDYGHWAPAAVWVADPVVHPEVGPDEQDVG